MFCYNLVNAGSTEHGLSSSIKLVIGLSISILINLILIGCGILLCRYYFFTKSRSKSNHLIYFNPEIIGFSHLFLEIVSVLLH